MSGEGSSVPIPTNVERYVMLAAEEMSEADIADNNCTIQLALTMSNQLTEISTDEMTDVHNMMDGTYSGWMDDFNSGNDPKLYGNDDANEISTTTTLISEGQQVYGAQTSTAQSTLSNLTSHLKSKQSDIKGLQSFMQQALKVMSYVATLLQSSLA